MYYVSFFRYFKQQVLLNALLPWTMNQFKQLNMKYHGKLFLQCYLARPNANVFVIIVALKRFIQFSRKLKFNLISVP